MGQEAALKGVTVHLANGEPLDQLRILRQRPLIADLDFISCQYHYFLLIYKGNMDSSYKIGQSFLHNWCISRYFYCSDIDPKWARPRFSSQSV